MSPDNKQPQQTSVPQPSFQPPQPQPQQNQAPAGVDPGHGLGVASLITSFFIGIVGLILGIIALKKSKQAGHSNGLALAGIIIGGINTITIIIIITLTILAAKAVVTTVTDAVKDGTVTINGVTTGGSSASTSGAEATVDDLYAKLTDQDFSTMAVGSSITRSSISDSIYIDTNNKDSSDSSLIRVNTPIITYIDNYFSQNGFTKKVGQLSTDYKKSSFSCSVTNADFMTTISVSCM